MSVLKTKLGDPSSLHFFHSFFFLTRQMPMQIFAICHTPFLLYYGQESWECTVNRCVQLLSVHVAKHVISFFLTHKHFKTKLSKGNPHIVRFFLTVNTIPKLLNELFERVFYTRRLVLATNSPVFYFRNLGFDIRNFFFSNGLLFFMSRKLYFFGKRNNQENLLNWFVKSGGDSMLCFHVLELLFNGHLTTEKT